MIQLHDARQKANMVSLNGEQTGRQTAKMVPVSQTARLPQSPCKQYKQQTRRPKVAHKAKAPVYTSYSGEPAP